MQKSIDRGGISEAGEARTVRSSSIGVWKSVALFYAIACGFTWIVWLPLVLGSDGLKLIRLHVSLPVSACIGTLGPFMACFISHRVQTGNWRAVRLLPPRPMQAIWLLAGPLLILFCFFFIFPAILTRGGPVAWHWHPSVLAGIFVPMFNYNLLGGPLFEEFGWRGFLQPRLQQVMPPWIAAVCVAILWAAWHLPLFLVGWSSASPLTFLFISIGLAVVMAAVFNASGRAVVVAILMHSAFNASSRFIPGFLGKVPTRLHPSPEILLGSSLLLVAAVTVIFTRGRIFASSGSAADTKTPETEISGASSR